MSFEPLTFTYCSPTADDHLLPTDVRLAIDGASPCVVVAAHRDDLIVAYVVATAAVEAIEVFCVDETRLVIAAARFRGTAAGLFHDRYRFSPSTPAPGEPTWFMETLLYEHPSQTVHIEEYVPGQATRTVFPDMDLADNYLPTPAPGDWAPLFAAGPLADV